MMRKITAIALTLSFLTSFGQQVFEKKFGSPSFYEEGTDVLALPQGGYLMSGAYNVNGAGWNSYLVRVDDNGDTLWTKQDLSFSGKMVAAGNDHIVYAGGNKAGFVYDSIRITKATIEGDVVWSASFFYPVCKNMVTDVTAVNGGYVVSGIYASNSCSNPMYDSFILKLDENGNKVWDYTLGGGGNDQIHAVKADAAGNIYAFGWTTTKTRFNDADYTLTKLNSNGQLQSGYTYGLEGNDYGYGMEIAADGGVLMTGYNSHMMLMKANAEGETEWTQTYGKACGGAYFRIANTPDGALALMGSESVDGQCTTVLMKADENGEVFWKNNWSGRLREFVETKTGAFIMTGYIDYLPDAYLVKYEDPIFTPAEDAAEEVVDSSEMHTGVNETTLEARYPSVKLYPNPATEYATISFSNQNNADYSLTIYNVTGSLMTAPVETRKSEITIERNEMAAGMYIYVLKGEGNLYSGQFFFQ